MRVTQVDLDALEKVARTLAGADLPLSPMAVPIEAAITELRALRELVGYAKEFRVGQCRFYERPNGWHLGTPEGWTVLGSATEAIEAARKKGRYGK